MPKYDRCLAITQALFSEAVRERYGVSDVVRLASNENPFGLSPAVRQALTGPGQPLEGLRIAPSVANFLFLDIGGPNSPVTEALLRQGIIKP